MKFLDFCKKSISKISLHPLQYIAYYCMNRLFSNRVNWVRTRVIKTYEVNSYIYYRTFSSDVALIRTILIDGEYNISFNCNFDLILDLGANIGLFSILYCNRFPEAKVIAVEPDTRNYDMLITNTKSFDNVHCKKAGVWFKNTNLSIVNAPSFYGIKVKENNCELEDSELHGVTIDSILGEYNYNKLLIKMDIEGTEEVIFNHIEESKWIDICNGLIIEIHSDKYESIIYNAMTGRGFSSFKSGENHVFIKGHL